MWKTIDDLKKQAEVLTDVVMHLNNRQVSSCHCSPRPKNDLIENNAVFDTSALSVDQSCSMGSFKSKGSLLIVPRPHSICSATK